MARRFHSQRCSLWRCFSGAPIRQDRGASDPLAEVLDTLGVDLLIPPPQDRKASFDEIRCVTTGEHFGAPQLSFAELAEGRPGNWGLSSTAAQRLDERVRLIARDRASQGSDFNGQLIRVREWSVERSTVAMRRRIHVVVDSTNFATLLATNEGLHLDPTPDPSSPIEPQPLGDIRNTCLDRVDQPSRSTCANLDMPPVPFARSTRNLEGIWTWIERAPVIRALALLRHEMWVAPFLVLETRCHLKFADIVAGHFVHASRAEGVFETGEHVLGIRIDSEEHAAAAVSWISAHRNEFTAGALTSTLLTLGSVLDPERVELAWGTPSAASTSAIECATT